MADIVKVPGMSRRTVTMIQTSQFRSNVGQGSICLWHNAADLSLLNGDLRYRLPSRGPRNNRTSTKANLWVELWRGDDLKVKSIPTR